MRALFSTVRNSTSCILHVADTNQGIASTRNLEKSDIIKMNYILYITNYNYKSTKFCIAKIAFAKKCILYFRNISEVFLCSQLSIDVTSFLISKMRRHVHFEHWRRYSSTQVRWIRQHSTAYSNDSSRSEWCIEQILPLRNTSLSVSARKRKKKR